MATKRTTKKAGKAATGPELTKLTKEQIAELDRNLTNFISRVRETGRLPIGGLFAGHGSHFQQ